MNCLMKTFYVFVLVIPTFSGLSESETGKDELVNEIGYHRKLYWEEGKREISDKKYDELVEMLRKIDPDNVLLKKSVEGGDKSDKVKHQILMRSLNKCYKKSAILEWCVKVARNEKEIFLIQPKYDGVAVEFFEGKLSTRGDGSWGRDISDKKSLIDFPAGEPKSRLVGELMISDKQFRRVKKLSESYVSPRHVVVAMSSSNDLEFWEKNSVRFDFVTYGSQQSKVTLSQLKKSWDELSEKVRKCGYLTDGFVVKIADNNYGHKLGFTHKYPKDALAFKWSCERKWSKLVGVSWQLAEKGIIPIGLVEPVELDGAIVKKVTLFNYGYIKKHSLQIGDSLQIERVGGTVPVIKGFKKSSDGRDIVIEKCPECGQKVEIDGSMIRCVNEACVGRISLAIYKELKRRKVKGFGIKTIRKIVDGLNLKCWDDLDKQSIEKLCSVKGISEKKANALKEVLIK